MPPTTGNPATTPPTVIYSGHGLSLSAACPLTGLAFTLQTTGGDAISIDGTIPTGGSPTATITTALNSFTLAATGAHTILFAGTDGAVVQLAFQESTTQTGADCYVFGTRIGG